MMSVTSVSWTDCLSFLLFSLGKLTSKKNGRYENREPKYPTPTFFLGDSSTMERNLLHSRVGSLLRRILKQRPLSDVLPFLKARLSSGIASEFFSWSIPMELTSLVVPKGGKRNHDVCVENTSFGTFPTLNGSNSRHFVANEQREKK
jgi:hypothetical protein